jgi:iron complex transport system substrate-binding protein
MPLAGWQRGFVQHFFLSLGTAKLYFACAVTIVTLLLARPWPSPAQTPSPAPSPAAPPTVPSVAPTREVTDEIGRTMRIPQSVRRIVSLAPSLTETVYALGLQNELVGDTDYCDFPPDAQHKPKVGGATNPSIEAIAALHPDLVLVTKSLNRLDTVRALVDLGIPSYATDPHTVRDILLSTQHLANLLGVPETAAAITKDFERRLADTQQRLSGLPQRRVLFVVWTEPLISVGRRTFIADALLHAGAVSIIDSAQDWPQVSLEDVVRRQPEFLVFAESHSDTAPPDLETLATLPGWRLLNAVRNRHYALVSDAINRPALRIVSVIEDLAKQLHPEAFTMTSGRGKEHQTLQRSAAPSAPTTTLRPYASLLSAVAVPSAQQLPPTACVEERPCSL